MTLDLLNGAVRLSLVTFLLCGFAYPFAVTGLSQVLLPYQANGSLEKRADGTVIGSQLIGQQWKDPQWFGLPLMTVPGPKLESGRGRPAFRLTGGERNADAALAARSLRARVADI